MLCGSRLILTSGLFITFLSGLSQVIPGSKELFELEWEKIVEAYQVQMDGPKKLQDLEEIDALVLGNSAKKEALIVEMLEGRANLLETAQTFS